jgi:F-type H+-transporting ATPase subunit gamma
MASTQEFRRRIKSVNSTSQITKAMEMVASVKMQKAQKAILAARSYVQNSWNLLVVLKKLRPEADQPLAGTSPKDHPLLAVPDKVEKTCVILITSDRGLCGSFNADVVRKASSFLNDESGKIDFITIGKKATDFAKRSQKGELVAEFPGFDNEVSYNDTTSISKIAIDDFLAGKYQEVLVIYSHFESSLRQIPVVKQVLPISENHIDNPEVWENESSRAQTASNNKQYGSSSTKENENYLPIAEYKFEPSADEVLERLIPLFIRLQVYGAILESNSSEHSARMVAMKNATDNAKELIDDLTLTYNAVRQNSITSEIAEICAGAEAMR